MTRTAIYTRQSEDKTGHAEAVQRQEEACRLVARSKGLKNPTLYSDNSISASSGKIRPAFERLVADIDGGRIDVVIVWHLDRLTRSMKDLTRVIEAGKPYRVNIATVHGTPLDLSDSTGIAVASILTAIAAMEVAHKSERQKDANTKRASKGGSFWTRRPFGYDRANGEVFTVESEAEAIQEAAKAVLSGETLASVARRWNDAGLRTTTKEGGLWGVTQLRRLLLNPRYSGRRPYVVVDEETRKDVQLETTGRWEAILDPEISRQLEAMLTDPRRRTAPDDLNSKYMLSGIAVCGKCGSKMFAAPVPSKGKAEKRMVYRCFGGYCMQRSLDDVDGLVKDLVIGRLKRPDAAALFNSGGDMAELRQKATVLRGRRALLAKLAKEGLLDEADVREQAGELTKELGEVENDISASQGLNPAAGVVGAADVAAAWAALPLGSQRQIIRALLTIKLSPAGKGHGFSPDQVIYQWAE